MTPDEYRKVKELFVGACERGTRERAHFLDEACGGDAAARTEIEALLAAEERNGGFLDSPLIVEGQLARNVADVLAERSMPLPRSVGRYKIVRLIGEGGMGTVFEAEQELPQRRVAVKLVRSVGASSTAMRRFQAEVHILGRLQHSCIAQVFDAGVADVDYEDGSLMRRPFFAMEYIEGTSLTSYTRERSLDVPATLRLFAEICDAVHYGHQRGVIHRDLKPANILIENTGRPKIIDFGVARLADAPFSAERTAAGQLIGTPQYMSPERLDARPEDVDIRGDVYSLGVILYELLCGRPPYDLEGLGLSAAARRIREGAVVRPRLVNHSLPGELESIVCRAMEGERERRYQSVAELAQDVRRFLHGEPVAARPPTLFYHGCKLVSRHKPAFAVAAGIMVLLVAFSATVLVQSVRLARERDQAAREASKAALMNGFLRSILESANPKSRGKDLTMHEVLDGASERVAAELGQEPEVEANVRKVIADTYWAMARLDEAKTHFWRAWEIQRSCYGDGHEETTCTALQLAELLRFKGEVELSERVLSDTLPHCRRQLGEDHPMVAKLVDQLGCAESTRGHYQEAERWLRDALEMRRRRLGPDHVDVAASLDHLAEVAECSGQADRCIRLQREAWAMRRRILGDKDLAVTNSRYELASSLSLRGAPGDRVEAERLLRETMLTVHAICGGESLDEAVMIGALATDLAGQDRNDEADRTYREAEAMKRRLLGNDHLELGVTLHNHAMLLQRIGRLQEAAQLFREALV